MKNNLKKELIRLGSTNPDLQKHIAPVLDKMAAMSYAKFEAITKTLRKHAKGEKVEITRDGGNNVTAEGSELAVLRMYHEIMKNGSFKSLIHVEKKGSKFTLTAEFK